jgi:hypothetical protein
VRCSSFTVFGFIIPLSAGHHCIIMYYYHCKRASRPCARSGGSFRTPGTTSKTSTCSARTQGATSRSVVFPGSPAVEWESLWDPQTVVKGGQTKTIDVHKPQLWITDVCRENCSPCTVSVWINK